MSSTEIEPGFEASANAQSKFRGCLLGVAVGDALGAPVEFMSIGEIFEEFGDEGIREMHEWGMFPPGSFTDDTQMTIATARGILDAHEAGHAQNKDEVRRLVHARYMDWYATQSQPSEIRGPGNTCLSALGSGRTGTTESKINNSKGCGGVMRVAPAGLAYPPGLAFEIAAELAAITHGHPSGYLSSGLLAEALSHIVRGMDVRVAFYAAIPRLKKYAGCEETLIAVDNAMKLAQKGAPPAEAIPSLGEGWVGEEALAIAVYCALFTLAEAREPVSTFKSCAAYAANHTGDSDSTASIACGILGAHFGESAIPAQWLAVLEKRDEIIGLADALYAAFTAG